MSIKALIFYGLLAIIPAYFINKWLTQLIRPGESILRLVSFIICVTAAAFSYVALLAYLLFN